MRKYTYLALKHQCFLSASCAFSIYLLEAVISLLFCIFQIMTIRIILSAFPSCPWNLWWPIQGEYNCECSTAKKRKVKLFFFLFISSCPTLHDWLWSPHACPSFIAVWHNFLASSLKSTFSFKEVPHHGGSSTVNRYSLFVAVLTPLLCFC